MTIAQAIARFVAETPLDAIPGAALDRARSSLVDTVGAALAGSRLRAGRIAVSLVEAEAGAGVATVLTARRRAAISQAAFANAVLASALDVDDGHYAAVGHPGAPVIPPALAAAEGRQRSGRELVTAVVLGYEVAIRAGLVLNARLEGRSYGSGMAGAYGAAAAVARLLGLDAARTAHALGITRCHLPVSTVWESVAYGAMVKESVGWGAMTGTVGALLAERGFTGPETVLDEPHHRDQSDLTGVTDLGVCYRIVDTYVKRFPACLMAHAAIEATLRLRSRVTIPVEEIAGLTVWSQAAAAGLIEPAPRSPEAAQYSLPYTVAAAWADGAFGVEQLADERLGDRRIRELAARVRVQHDPALDRTYPARRSARVSLRTTGGQTFDEEVLVLRGSSEEPLTPAEIDAKFFGLAEPVIGKPRAARVLEVLRQVDAYPDLSPLWRALGAAE